MVNETSFRCWKCHEFVRATFKHAGPANVDYWYGDCPNCGERNIIRKPSWTKRLLEERAEK